MANWVKKAIGIAAIAVICAGIVAIERYTRNTESAKNEVKRKQVKKYFGAYNDGINVGLEKYYKEHSKYPSSETWQKDLEPYVAKGMLDDPFARKQIVEHPDGRIELVDLPFGYDRINDNECRIISRGPKAEDKGDDIELYHMRGTKLK